MGLRFSSGGPRPVVDWSFGMRSTHAPADCRPSRCTPAAQLLCNLPTAAPRGLALHQFAGAVLLERLLPASNKLAPAKSAINRRDATRLDPVAVIEAQPWFSNGKRMVEGATSGAAVVPHGGYSMGE